MHKYKKKRLHKQYYFILCIMIHIVNAQCIMKKRYNLTLIPLFILSLIFFVFILLFSTIQHI